MATTALTERQQKLVYARLTKKNHQTLFGNLTPEFQLTVVELIEKERVNGELEEWFELGGSSVTENLKVWRTTFEREKSEKDKTEKEQLAEKEKKERELMQDIVNLMLGMLTMEFMKNVFKLTSSSLLDYEQTLQKLKEFNDSLMRKYLAPIFSAYGIVNEEAQQRIQRLALKNLYCDLFTLSPSLYSNYTDSVQYETVAKMATIKCQGEIFCFAVTDSDESVREIMQAKYTEVIKTAAETYSKLSGTPVENVIRILDNYAPTVLKKLKEAVLA